MKQTVFQETRHRTAAVLIEHELAQIFHSRIRAAASYNPMFAELWTLASERVGGGKFVRPLLCIDMFSALTGSKFPTGADELADESKIDVQTAGNATLGATERITETPTDSPSTLTHARWSDVLRVAATLEVLHYSFLLHDDVIDGDLMRRGKPNLIGELAKELDRASFTAAGPGSGDLSPQLHWARSNGILMGDLLLAEAHQLIARLDVDTHTRTRLLDLLAHSIDESIAGEQIDVGLSDGIIASEMSTVLEMCRQKTATYTFELPLRAAAVFAGSGSQVETVLATAGSYLGLAFQLQDDLLSSYGDPDEHGKDAFSDLREGKETALIAYARMTPSWPSIEPHFGQPTLTESRGQEVRGQLTECGAATFVQNLIDEQLRALSELLADHAVTLPAAAREVLTNLAAQLDGRAS